jgi:phage-related minor tail protein
MAFRVSVDIALIDKISSGLRKIDGALLKSAKTAQKAGESFKRAGKVMTDFGKNLSLKVTAPILGLAAASLKLFDTQIQSEQKLAASLRAGGEEVENNLASFKEFASGLQAITTVGDEATLSMLGIAKTMGLSNENSQQAVKQAIGLSSAMGISAESAIRMTAALADGDAMMLTRYFPTLKKIKDSTERAKVAQDLLNKAFQQSKVEAQEGLGPLKQLQNQFGDLLEEFGAIVAEGILPVINKLKGMISTFQDLSPGVKKTIVIIGALLAVIGPLLLVIGAIVTQIGVMLVVLPTLGATITATVIPALIAMSAAMIPILVVAAKIILVIALIVGAFKLWMFTLRKLKSMFEDTFGPIGDIVDAFIEKLDNISPVLGNIARAIKDTVVNNVMLLVKGLRVVEDIINRMNPFGDGPQAEVNQGDQNNAFNKVQESKVDVTIIEDRDEQGNLKGIDVTSGSSVANVKTIQRGTMTRLFT